MASPNLSSAVIKLADEGVSVGLDAATVKSIGGYLVLGCFVAGFSVAAFISIFRRIFN